MNSGLFALTPSHLHVQDGPGIFSCEPTLLEMESLMPTEKWFLPGISGMGSLRHRSLNPGAILEEAMGSGF